MPNENMMLDVGQLYYDIEKNRFFDEDGFYVDNIYSFITPNMLYLFRATKEYMCFEVNSGYFVELIYPEEDADYIDYALEDNLPFL